MKPAVSLVESRTDVSELPWAAATSNSEVVLPLGVLTLLPTPTPAYSQDPSLRRIRQWHPTPLLLLGKSHGRRTLVGCSPWVAKSRTRLSDFTFTFHFHALEKEMATHSSVLAWRIPGTGEPGGLPSMGSQRVGTTEATWHSVASLRKHRRSLWPLGLCYKTERLYNSALAPRTSLSRAAQKHTPEAGRAPGPRGAGALTPAGTLWERFLNSGRHFLSLEKPAGLVLVRPQMWASLILWGFRAGSDCTSKN